MKLVVDQNIENDGCNWRRVAKDVGIGRWGVDWSQKIPKDVPLECVNDIACLRKYLKDKFYNTGMIDSAVRILQKEIDQLPVQKDVESSMDKRFVEDKMTIYFTTVASAPYNLEKSYFFVIYWSLPKQLSNVYHELQHFLFHRYSWQICRDNGLSAVKTGDLKESMTVLMNKTLKERGIAEDPGYPNHQIIRQKIVEFNDKGMKYDELLLEMITWLKKYRHKRKV